MSYAGGHIQSWFATVRIVRAPVPIELADFDVFVETEAVRDFFLEEFRNALGHGGIKRGSVSQWPFRARRRAAGGLHPKSAAPLRSWLILAARGRVHHARKVSRYWYPGRNLRL